MEVSREDEPHGRKPHGPKPHTGSHTHMDADAPALTDDEHALIDLLCDVTDGFSNVIGSDPFVREQDAAEVIAHIHALQDKVLAQAAARLYPDRYRLMGERITDNQREEANDD